VSLAAPRDVDGLDTTQVSAWVEFRQRIPFLPDSFSNESQRGLSMDHWQAPASPFAALNQMTVALYFRVELRRTPDGTTLIH
jgi:hypothetical protein